MYRNVCGFFYSFKFKPLRNNYFIILLVIISSNVFSQNVSSNFSKEIAELNGYGNEIISTSTNEEKLAANSKFKSELNELIKTDGSFDFEFDSLKTISILKANNLKIYNWTVPLTDGTFEYFAFLQIKEDENKYTIVELIDKSEEIKSPENKILTAKNWYGALYYKLIYDKKLGEDYYTVLGWDGNNNLTNKKIIDVISVGNHGMLKIGASIFKSKSKTQKRVIFEYSENAVMSLKYHEGMNKIVFDFLVPENSNLKDIYEYYGPALNRFDAYHLEKGKWNYEEDVNIEQDRSIKDMMWKDPKKN